MCRLSQIWALLLHLCDNGGERVKWNTAMDIQMQASVNILCSPHSANSYFPFSPTADSKVQSGRSAWTASISTFMGDVPVKMNPKGFLFPLTLWPQPKSRELKVISKWHKGTESDIKWHKSLVPFKHDSYKRLHEKSACDVHHYRFCHAEQPASQTMAGHDWLHISMCYSYESERRKNCSTQYKQTGQTDQHTPTHSHAGQRITSVFHQVTVDRQPPSLPP